MYSRETMILLCHACLMQNKLSAPHA